MTRKRLIYQIFYPFLIILVLAVSAFGIFSASTLRRFYFHNISNELNAEASLIRHQILATGILHSDELLPACQEMGDSTGTRITVIDPAGVVLADSREDPAEMDNHGQRPEIMTAYLGETGKSMRFSNTLQQDMMYLAKPIMQEGEIAAVIRVSLPLTKLRDTIWSMQSKIIGSGFFIALIAALVSFWVSRRISTPLEEMKQGAKRFANEDFRETLQLKGAEEIEDLASSLNQMADQLERRISTSNRQRSEQDAVLSSMKEGVLAVDNDNLIIRINDSAVELLDIQTSQNRGESIFKVIVNVHVQEFILRALESQKELEKQISLTDDNDRVLKVFATPLIGTDDVQLGTLLVMNDVTELRRLENMRREFVANVSHELKTPITSIKGFVETIRDGMAHDTEKVIQFLNIIERQTDRLNAIIEDLLELSKIEQRNEGDGILFENHRIQPILEEAIQNCQVLADKYDVDVRLDCPYEIEAPVNVLLLQQAASNLVDNAIKYSNPGQDVLVTCVENNEVIVSVHDWGIGIPAQHLPRLFERFYRVDKARSRKQGGTGLGLAIVKHIALSHSGRVTVKSSPGEGSTFSFHLPRAKPEGIPVQAKRN